MGIVVVKKTPRKAKQKSMSNKDVKETVKGSNIVVASRKTTPKKATAKKGNQSLAIENRDRGTTVRKIQKRTRSYR
jgi:hypothetical protein